MSFFYTYNKSRWRDGIMNDCGGAYEGTIEY